LAQEKRPRRGRRAEAVCVGTLAGGGLGGKVSCELAAIFLDLRRMRIKQFRLRSRIVDSLSQQLRPRIADSLSQHLAQLSLSLRRFAREGFVPYTHEWYMGMPEGK